MINRSQAQSTPLSIKNVPYAFPMMILGYVFTYYDFHMAFSKLNYDVLFILHGLSLSHISE